MPGVRRGDARGVGLELGRGYSPLLLDDRRIVSHYLVLIFFFNPPFWPTSRTAPPGGPSRARGIPLSIGSDSNVRIDPLEELRELEGIARRQTGRRGVFSTERLLCFGADEGARSLGLEEWPEIQIDLGHESLRGVEAGDVFDALVSSCSADVLSA